MRSRSIEEVRDALARIYAKPVLTPTDGARSLDAVMNYCPMNDVRLYYRGYGADVRLEYPGSGCLMQLVPLRGRGELVFGGTTIALTPGQTVVLPADRRWQLRSSADYEQIGVGVDAETLTRKLMSMTGAAIAEPVRIEPLPGSASPMAYMLSTYIQSLVDTMSRADPAAPLPAWWVAQTEQLLMTMMLCCNRHNYSHLLEAAVPEVAAMEVRRAENYIEANWREPITLQDVADAVGVSEFALFRSFRRHRDYTPLEFLAQVRSLRAGSES